MSRKCEPGCTCKRHQPKSEEHLSNVRAANQARKGESHKCPPGCTCNRHKAHYRGGSKKGRTFSPEALQNMAEGRERRVFTPEGRQSLSDHLTARREDPEFVARAIAARQEVAAPCLPGCECGKHSEEFRQRMVEVHLGTTHSEETKAKIGAGSKAFWALKTPHERSEIAWQRIKRYGISKVSKTEYILAPYLATLNYEHNFDKACHVGRRFPDFYDENGKCLFEYFGNYWHPRLEEEQEVIDYYRLLGWSCTVLWESNIFEWLRDNKHLVTKEQHEGTWAIAKRLVPSMYHLK